MALNPAQVLTLAEILQTDRANTEALISSLNPDADDEIYLGAEITLWNENKNLVDTTLDTPSGVKWKAQWILDAIRGRIRKAFGLSLYSEEVQGSSGAIPTAFVF